MVITLSEPFREPPAVGLKLTLIVQVIPPCRLPPTGQELVCAKLFERLMAVIPMEALATFRTVMFCAALEAPTV